MADLISKGNVNVCISVIAKRYFDLRYKTLVQPYWWMPQDVIGNTSTLFSVYKQHMHQR